MQRKQIAKEEITSRTFELDGEPGLRNLKELIRSLGDAYLFRFIDDDKRNIIAVSRNGHDRHKENRRSYWVDEREVMKRNSLKPNQFTYANGPEGAIKLIRDSEKGDPAFDSGGFIFLVFRREKMEMLVCYTVPRLEGHKYVAYRFLDDPRKCLFGQIIVNKAPAEKIFPELVRI